MSSATKIQKDKTVKPQGTGRRTILRASTKLFAQHGFEGVTMRQIAKAADITLPSIYHHFGNKSDLYRAVEEEMYSAHADKLLAALVSSENPEQNLRNFISTLFNHLIENPNYLKLLQRGLIEDWDANQEYLVETAMQGVFDELKLLLANFNPNSEKGPFPIMIFSLIIGFLTMQPVTRKLQDYAFSKLAQNEQLEQLTDLTISLIRTQN